MKDFGSKNKKQKSMTLPFYRIQKGFTLVELLVVMAIIGVLVGLVGANFRTAQIRGRDVQRKSDLKNISTSLELMFSDYERYPSSDANGNILACSYDTVGVCDWGTDEITDSKTIYMKILPQDPASSSYQYFYRIVPDSGNQKFQLFAHLENSEDQDCINANCVDPVAYSCGSAVCNFSITSANTIPTE